MADNFMYGNLDNDGEGAFAVNEAAIYFSDDGNDLVVAFGDGKVATLELERDEERSVVKTVLGDANTWASFLGSLSAALKQHV